MQSLMGKFPRPQAPPKRNFIQENVRNVKLMQQHNQHINQANKCEFEKKRPQRKIRSTSHSRLCSSTNWEKTITTSKSTENVTKFDYQNCQDGRASSVRSRDASSQTESVDDELFLKDVIIRLPSASIISNKERVENPVVEFEPPLNHIFDNGIGDGHDHDYIDGIEEIEPNQQSAERNKAKIIKRETRDDEQLCAKTNNKNVIPTSYRKGELPKYLKEMKIKEDKRNRLIQLFDVNCPPGHTVLTEDERIESLNIAQKKYQDLISELNHMPLTSETLRIRNRRIEIEKELRQLDNTLQIFSRAKVYVKIDN